MLGRASRSILGRFGRPLPPGIILVQEAAVMPFLARFLRLRYILFGSALGGGLAARKKYNDLKDAIPDTSWIRDFFPEDVADKFEEIYQSLIHAISARPPEINEAAIPSNPSINNVHEQMIEMQSRFQKEIQRLEQENRDLKSKVLEFSRLRSCSHSVFLKNSLIDMYSRVLDELSDFDENYAVQDQLPRVVVVGDQSSGKTSVLEMITRARIFPRGAGEMMTRTPVRVTLGEGAYHVARFNDSEREYDLNLDCDRKALQDEIERRMKESLVEGETVSRKVISLSVVGPGLQRMVLVDLPGIISTQTQDMASDTKSTIVQLATEYLRNPNAIILCIQDGSVDAERSNVTDLVSQIDPDGQRTIFVLTKIDCAENAMFNSDRIKRILDGKLFPMKALGYFAVVAGRGNASDYSIEQISAYENEFFHNSKLIRSGVLKPSQVTTANLGMAVSSCFWSMVKQSVCQQTDIYKASLYSLEAEWRNKFTRLRQKSRNELFDIASTSILDKIVRLSEKSAADWESMLFDELWNRLSQTLLSDLYIPASQTDNLGAFNTKIDIGLNRMIDEQLPRLSIQVAKDCVVEALGGFVGDGDGDEDRVLDSMKQAIEDEVKKRFQWDEKAFDSLRIIQKSSVDDRHVPDKESWQSAIGFMEKSLKSELGLVEREMKEVVGDDRTFWQRWLFWKNASDDQIKAEAVIDELSTTFRSAKVKRNLSIDEVSSVRGAVRRNYGFEVDNEQVVDLWRRFVYRKVLCETALASCSSCWKFFFYYQKGFVEHGLDCREVEFFWRLKRLLELSSHALRLQIFSVEGRRLERIIKETLEEYSRNERFKREFIRGESVDLAEKISRVRSILQHLEDFSKALSEENP